MLYQQSVIETMKRRQSIRTYETEVIKQTDVNKILEFINQEENVVGPFGTSGRMEYVAVTKNVSDKGIKLGTYGFIKNPQGYIVGISVNEKYSLIEFAFTFHKLVLYLSELGLGTCWMGGTFTRSTFEQEIALLDSEFIPCITPIGYPKEKQRVFDKALRYVVKADNKKSWNQLFYTNQFKSPLTEEAAGLFDIPLEMVRIGPSASNKQPWRLVLSNDGKTVHFYIEHTPNYSAKLGYDMQLLDMGIAMCQFELACNELKLNGSWIVKDPNFKIPNENFEYVSSWKAN
ncbi:nitroreductase [Cytobacillus spongiae]|uniref:nitroreductase family protein n=1 Tax=Cytobacillus spongiae TaxID=2901381 RepID=UPI001F49161C|nr:nitroreductase family protein [Cytobacillus spongiae]UII57082.1 nitroreductase [Cytobacillus spongiae]